MVEEMYHEHQWFVTRAIPLLRVAAWFPPGHLTGEDKSLGAYEEGLLWRLLSLGLNTRGLHRSLWSNIIRGTNSVF